MTIWKWNDVELEIDLEDVDFQERYEKAFEVMGEEEKNLKKIGKLSFQMWKIVRIIAHFFEPLWISYQKKKGKRKINSVLLQKKKRRKA